MSTTATAKTEQVAEGLHVVPFAHPQGCRAYLLADADAKQALVLDPHLDLVEAIADEITRGGWQLRYVVDSHTHADHPSGAAALAARFKATRVAHEAGQHIGVTHHPAHGERLALGAQWVEVLHTPGHTPDHLVLRTPDAVFTGDSILIGGVARTDFLGGDAGQLFDSIQSLLQCVSDDTRLYPGHDYEGRTASTVGSERANNPWLAMQDRDAFVVALTANPPPRPANMDDLLRLNREGVALPEQVSVAEMAEMIQRGGVGSVIDVRMGAEFAAEHIAGSRLIPLDQLTRRADEVRQTPAPRLLLCRTGRRAGTAQRELERLGIGGSSVVDGGIVAYAASGGETVKGREHMSIERQVRIAAGALVLLGVVLGTWVTPWAYALSAFVGAGLVFAGVTDRCGMAVALGALPWNRAEDVCEMPSAGGGCAASAPPPASCAAGAPQ